MARTAHTARKIVASGSKVGSKERKMGGGNPTKSLSVRTPTIGQQEKPKKIKSDNSKTIMREIKYYQTNIGHLIPKAGLVRLIRGLSRETLKNMPVEGLRFTSAALNILQESIENHLVCLLELSYMATRHAKRITLFASDIRLINRIKKYGK